MKWNDFKYDILYRKFYKGWCNKKFASYDAWNLNDELVDWTLYRILILMNEHCGYPITIVKDAVEKGLITKEESDNYLDDNVKKKVSDICNTLWTETLWEIAKGLASYRCKNSRNNRFYKKDYDDAVEKEITEWENCCQKRFNNSMKMIFKYFDNLWD